VRPLLLVDVDGVLCPFGGPMPDGYQAAQLGAEGDLRWSEQNAGRLERLAEVFDCAWCTARYDDVLTTIARLHGFGEDWPVVSFEGGAYKSEGRYYIVRAELERDTTWKLPFVRVWLEQNGWEDRPLAWLDDDTTRDVYLWEWERNQQQIPTLVWHVSPALGLTNTDTNHVRAWGESHLHE
jgi:hypothetical protein